MSKETFPQELEKKRKEKKGGLENQRDHVTLCLICPTKSRKYRPISPPP